LRQYGACGEHRRSFAPVAHVVNIAKLAEPLAAARAVAASQGAQALLLSA
jgi:ribonuclease HII